jgi:peptidylamidoglycolate lyase
MTKDKIALNICCTLLAAAFTLPLVFAAQGAYRVVHGWPQLPPGFAFDQCPGVAVDSRNQVFVFHRGKDPVMYFEGATGKHLGSWGDGLFPRPHGLTIDQQDNLWLTDITLHQVFKFRTNGELLMTVGEKNVPGVDARHFNRPTDVAVAPNGDFYVADGYGNSRVAKFNARGEFLLEWGRKGTQPGEFDTPHGIALDRSGRVYVADRANARVQIFDANGKFLDEWKSAELGRPWDVFVSPSGSLFVVDGGDVKPQPPDRGRVSRLDLKGAILEQFGSFGRYDGQIYWGHAVAVSKQDEVYVSDILGMRAQKFARP